ncbi:MAG: RimK/LysX family protein [Candidatus Saccharimonadales bacterium]
MLKTIGAFAKVSFPDLGIYNTIAKVDTGALSGALHATNIVVVKLPTGERALKFTPYGQKKPARLTAYRRKKVRSSNGALEWRYVIRTTIVIRDVSYPINITLADRSQMMKAVIIGRRFLRRHGFLVDPKKGTKYRYEVK